MVSRRIKYCTIFNATNFFHNRHFNYNMIIRKAGVNLNINTTDEEREYRRTEYPNPRTVMQTDILCTACGANVNQMVKENKLLKHPHLDVIVCKKCTDFYGDGNFSLDEDGAEKYCHWCGQGGTVCCCNHCTVIFCKKCIRRNLPKPLSRSILSSNDDDWRCFVCDSRPLWRLRAICNALENCMFTGKRQENGVADSTAIYDVPVAFSTPYEGPTTRSRSRAQKNPPGPTAGLTILKLDKKSSESNSDDKSEDSQLNASDDVNNTATKNMNGISDNNCPDKEYNKTFTLTPTDKTFTLTPTDKTFTLTPTDKPYLDKLILDFDSDTKEVIISVHPDLIKKLKPYQAEGVKFMWDACFESAKRMETESGSGCILAHCMEFGKTLQVVTLVHTLLTHELTKVKNVLIICPLSTILNWVNEFEIWLDDINECGVVEVFHLITINNVIQDAQRLKKWRDKGGVCIIEYETFKSLVDVEGETRLRVGQMINGALLDPGPDFVICDDVHMLENEQMALSKAMTRIKTTRRVVLTGTPIENNLKEYLSMVPFVKPNLFGDIKEFYNRFVNQLSTDSL